MIPSGNMIAYPTSTSWIVRTFRNIFASEVEHGKSTAQVGKVLQLMQSLGMRVSVEIPSRRTTRSGN